MTMQSCLRPFPPDLGNVPSGTQIFSLSHPRDLLNIPSFLISFPSLKFTIFLHLSPIGHIDIANPNSMQDVCHHELSQYDLC